MHTIPSVSLLRPSLRAPRLLAAAMLASTACTAFTVYGDTIPPLLQQCSTTPLPLSLDKSGYHLFNPTPRDQMRELSADRPDKIESPYTVDAGHFQIETDFVGWTEDWSDGERTRTWNGPTPNLKVGLLNNVDFELSFDTFLSQRGKTAGSAWKRSGVGDMEARVKVNLVGNDEGDFAMALLPYVHLPTSHSGLGSSKVEGGLILPFAFALPGGWNLGLQVAGHALENDGDGGYHAQFDQAIGLGHDIVGNLAGYVEFFSGAPTKGGWIGTLDVGLTYAITDDIQLDCGVNIGLSPAAEDWNPFTGITMRF